jgi:hypothetical protein
MHDWSKRPKRKGNMQAKLELMKRWSAKRLTAETPRWAKPSRIKPFKPQLSQRFPDWTYR